MREAAFWAILLLSFRLSAQSTVYKFDVLMNGDLIGTLTATKNTTGKKVVKNLSNTTKTKVFLLSIHVESEIYASYENDILTGSFAYRHVNRGAENIETTVKLLPDKRYKVAKNGVEKFLPSDAIRYTVVDLYFKEPKGLTSVFSNTHGDFIKMASISPNQYEITLPDGKKNIFTYLNGKLMKVEAPVAVGNIVFKRKN